MTEADIEHLTMLATAATPGPWLYRDGNTYGALSSLYPGAIARDIERHGAAHVRAYGGSLVGESIERRNGDYLAAAAPEVILSLLAVARAAHDLLSGEGLGKLAGDAMFDGLREALGQKLGD